MAFVEHNPVRPPGAPVGSDRAGLRSSRAKPGNPMNEKAASLVKDVGGKVPHYNMDYHQHHRLPFKNKEAYLGIKELPEWNKKVEHRTRTELMQARKAERIPDMSYDIDGDGVVGQKDYFIGKLFDAGHKDRLDPHERQKALKALNEGFMDRFDAGYDQSGAKRMYPTQQKRGCILTCDNVDVIGQTYPPHPNAHVVPKHKTQTELSLDRLGDRKNTNYKLKVKWDERYPYMVPEQPAYQDNWVENPVIHHIAQRANADHQASRVRAGLLPENTYVNPERESKQPGLHWEDNPTMQTRGQLNETRKELMKRDLDEQRLRGERTYIPMEVRAAQKDEAAYEFRRGHMANMTKTRMEDYRKKERIEYDMAHFGLRMKELPRYNDQPHPWWTLKQMNRHMSAPSMVERAKPEQTCLKITQTRPDMRSKPKRLESEERGRQELIVAKMPELERQEPGVKTVKRWTTDIIEHNQLRNMPRLFDTLRPAKTQAKELAPLENFSSFDWTRNQALRQQAEARRRNMEYVPRSKLDPGQMPDGPGAAVSTVSYDQQSTGQQSKTRARSMTGSSSLEGRRSASHSRAPTYDALVPERMATRARSVTGGISSLDYSGGDAGRGGGMTRTESAPTLLRVNSTAAFPVRTGGFNRMDAKNESAPPVPARHM